MSSNINLEKNIYDEISENADYKIGVEYLLKNDLENAFESFTKAYEKLNKEDRLRNSEEFCQFLLLFSDLSINKENRNNDDKRISIIQEAIEILKRLKLEESKLYADCLHGLAVSYSWKYENSNDENEKSEFFDRSYELLKESRSLYEKLDLKSRIIRCIELEQNLSFISKDFKKSIDLNELELKMLLSDFRMQEFSERVSRTLQIAEIYLHIGDSNG